MNKSKTVYIVLILILIITFINIYYYKKTQLDNNDLSNSNLVMILYQLRLKAINEPYNDKSYEKLKVIKNTEECYIYDNDFLNWIEDSYKKIKKIEYYDIQETEIIKIEFKEINIYIYFVKKDKYIIKTFDTINTRYYVISGIEFESLLNLINY